MEIYNNKSIWCLKHHIGVMLRGFAKMLPSLTTTTLLVIGIYCFTLVTRHSGYLAVFDFLHAALCSAAALIRVYTMGEEKKVHKR